ncbi:MAG: helix-turn-helix transcriptional regulator [Treponema sp.]|nr:helix-turn-helix transcriptional regulator [Candidatus Treponema equifaecale]
MTSEELQTIFSENLRRYRRLNNFTQQHLAELADISVGYLCDLESGKKWGTADTITKLANALKIQPYQMYFQQKPSLENSVYSDLINLSQNFKQYLDIQINNIIEKNNL